MQDGIFALFQTDLFHRVLHIAKLASPFWVPALLGLGWFQLYINTKRREWIKQQGGVVLEIKLPKEILKGPGAMELVLNGIYEPVIGTLMDVYFKGRMRPWFSLEIASIEGHVKFFIWCLPTWKRNVEARLYAQYPNIEIQEVPDYTLGTHYDPERTSIASFHTTLVKDQIYPIKTYIDYGLDKKGDEEEEKIDPITPLLEWMGTLKAGEQCWVQIMIQAHRKEGGLQDVKFFSKPSWDKKVKSELQKFIKESTVAELEEGKKPRMLDLTKVQQETIEAVQRGQTKLPYDTMIRAVYIANKENYNSMATAGMIHSFRHFGSFNLNGIKPVFNGIDYPWQDFKGIRIHRYRRMLIDAYKRRSAFNGPYKHWMAKPYVLNVEELATLFHFPGAVASTPTLTRVPSKKAEAPANLPI